MRGKITTHLPTGGAAVWLQGIAADDGQSLINWCYGLGVRDWERLRSAMETQLGQWARGVLPRPSGWVVNFLYVAVRVLDGEVQPLADLVRSERWAALPAPEQHAVLCALLDYRAADYLPAPAVWERLQALHPELAREALGRWDIKSSAGVLRFLGVGA